MLPSPELAHGEPPMAAAADTITVKMTKVQALAFLKVFDIGLRVAQALGLIQNTMSAEQARNILNQAATQPK